MPAPLARRARQTRKSIGKKLTTCQILELFEQMGTTGSQLVEEEDRLWSDHAYYLTWCTPTWAAPQIVD